MTRESGAVTYLNGTPWGLVFVAPRALDPYSPGIDRTVYHVLQELARHGNTRIAGKLKIVK